jgi:lysophospholipase L1-like esterase
MSTLTIVALGDSTTAGTPLFKSPIEAPPDGSGDERSQYAYWLMRARPDWRVLNHGVNRERTEQIAARFDRDVAAHRPAAVVILAGVNDVYEGRDSDSVIASLRAIYDRAAAAGIPVVAASIVPYDTATPAQNARMHEINAWIAAEAERDPRITFADTRRAAASPENIDRLSGSPDGLHPDVDGYRRMAEVIGAALARRLASTSATS